MSDEVSRSTCFAKMDLNHVINSRGKNLIDVYICCVGSSVKYHSLSYWSIMMTHRYDFQFVKFVPNRYKKSFKMA